MLLFMLYFINKVNLKPVLNKDNGFNGFFYRADAMVRVQRGLRNGQAGDAIALFRAAR